MSRPVLGNVEALQGYMKQNGLTQKAMAERLGISAEYLGKVLKQESTPSLDLLYRLGEVTGAPWWRYMLPDELTVVRREDAEAWQGFQAMLRRDLQAVGG